ncbi:lipopolysaccharide biosynthesis protein [Consotaella aegiceratis]|uniref:lipopolysaccharide biosynthesis protein n=1 Tax=Consotaella aegiceratis TaxID=3097961 RepID=UPI002F408026
MPPHVSIRTVTNNVGWSMLSRTGTFALKFFIVPILARLLSPEEFGVVAVALTVVQFLAMIGGAGLAAALIIEPEDDQDSVHSVFWANLAVSCLMALVLFLGADFFATLLGAREAAYLLRIMSILIPLQLSGDVAYALLARRMAFHKDAMWSVTSESLGVLVALALAFSGWTITALVAQQFVAAIVRVGGCYTAARYVPRFVVSLPTLRRLAGFSLGLMGSDFANFITFQSPLVVITRFLGLADAGAYSVANRFSSIPNQVMLTALMGVLFPAFRHMTDDRQRRFQALMLSTQVSTVFLAPMMFGLWAVAEPAMLVLFGEKWAYAWPVLGLLALSKGIMSPCGTFIPYLKGVQQGGVLWWSAMLRAILVTGCVAYGAATGSLITAMVALCIANAITLVGYSWAVLRTSDGPVLRNFLMINRPMISAAVMAVLVRLLLVRIDDLVPSAIGQILVGAAAGALIYALLLLLLERPLVRKMAGLVLDRLRPEARAGA